MYCKNCDKLIDADEQICHYCNTNPRRRETVRTGNTAPPASKPKQKSGMLGCGIAVLIVGLLAMAFIFLITFDTTRVYSEVEWWYYDEWHEMTTVPWLEYETVTLAQLHENPQWFEGMPVRVMGQVVDSHAIVDPPEPVGSGRIIDVLSIIVREILLIVEEDGIQVAVRAERDFIMHVTLDGFYWFYGTFTDPFVIMAHHIVPIN